MEEGNYRGILNAKFLVAPQIQITCEFTAQITIPPKKTMTIGLPTNESERSHLQMKNKKSDNLVN